MRNLIDDIITQFSQLNVTDTDNALILQHSIMDEIWDHRKVGLVFSCPNLRHQNI